MCFNSSTKAKKTPYLNDTTQSVALPSWLTAGSQQAVQLGQQIANKPYTPYTGTLVAPESTNLVGASTTAANSANVGQDPMNLGMGSLTDAANTANANTNAGQDALSQASGLDTTAGNVANATMTAGLDQANNYSDMANLSSGTAINDMSAGQDALNTAGNIANLSSTAGLDQASNYNDIANLASGTAVNDMNVGQGDISSARNYTTDLSSAITPDQIAQYFNPYVKMAVDPAADQVKLESAQNANAIDSQAAMRGAFGGSRTGILESQNQFDLQKSLAGLYGTGYSNAYDKAIQAATDQKNRQGQAAQLSLSTSAASSSAANDALSRLLQSGAAQGDVAKLLSGLATDSTGRLISTGTAQSQAATDALNRLLQSGASQGDVAKLMSGLATDAQGRLTSAGAADTSLSAAQNDAANASVNRDVATTQAANQTTSQQEQQLNDYINRLVSTGQIDQAQAQNLATAMYGQFQNQQAYPTQQLQALLSSLSTVPYGTDSTSHSSGYGTQLVQQPSVGGQIVGALGTAAGAIAGL
jgi:hypothetical protein